MSDPVVVAVKVRESGAEVPDVPDGVAYRARRRDAGGYDVWPNTAEDRMAILAHRDGWIETVRARRRDAEDAGLVITITGLGSAEVPTDDRTALRVLGAISEMEADESYNVEYWQTSDGQHLPVTVGILREIRRHMREYKSACFARQRELEGTPGADLSQGWPLREVAITP